MRLASTGRPFVFLVLGSVLFGGILTSCQTLRQLQSLQEVTFRIDRATDVQLAKINLDRLDSFGDLRSTDVAQLTSALSRGELPLSFTLHVEATNPESNPVTARLTQMDWTLLMNDRETIQGTFDREVELPPGTPTNVPVDLDLDLVRFFDNNLRDLVGLATSLSGEGPPTNVKLRVQPTVRTSIGPIEYPKPITVVSKDVGQ